MDSDFKKWVTAMGFNQKQVATAAALIGMKEGIASIRNRGEKEPDLMERLAMAAVAAGIPPWDPTTQAEIEAYATIIDATRKVVADLRPSFRPAASNGHHIPAE
jgi:hypothetical protein